jgi:ABC-2 type transport system permease protein
VTAVVEAPVLERAVPAPSRGWRTIRVPALIQVNQALRIPSTLSQLVVQLVLYYFLWHAMYAHTTLSAGLTVDMAVTYALLAILHMRIRWTDAASWRESILMHVRQGSIAYWFLRPMSAQRFYFFRSLGEVAYGSVWALGGFLALLFLGAVTTPASSMVTVAFVVTLALGQVINYYIICALDLLCFWTVSNAYAVRMYVFIRNFLSGAFVPLWFLPGWLLTITLWLPFQATLNVPLSVYVGRIGLSEVPGQIALQLGWCLALAVLCRWMWRKAANRITVQGG